MESWDRMARQAATSKHGDESLGWRHSKDTRKTKVRCGHFVTAALRRCVCWGGSCLLLGKASYGMELNAIPTGNKVPIRPIHLKDTRISPSLRISVHWRVTNARVATWRRGLGLTVKGWRLVQMTRFNPLKMSRRCEGGEWLRLSRVFIMSSSAGAGISSTGGRARFRSQTGQDARFLNGELR